MTDDDPLMTVNEVAKFFSLKPSTIRRWIRDEKLKAVKINNYYRVRRSVVHAMAQEMYGEN